MYLRRGLLSLLTLTLLGAAAPATPLPNQEPLDPDEYLLATGGVATNDATLLQFVKACSIGPARADELPQLLQALASGNFKTREEACARLIRTGPNAVPALRQVLGDSQPEVAKRAAACLAAIERGDSKEPLVLAAARLLVRRRSAGAVESLLGYLPCARDEAAEEEIAFALYTLAREGELETAILKSLHASEPAQRAIAACIVARKGTREQRQAVRQLLRDPSSAVQLRAAQGLLAAGDKAGIPTLIELLGRCPVPLVWQAEELLRWAAGDGAPAEVMGSGAASAREKCIAAWKTWWDRIGPSLDLTQPDYQARRPGLVLAICYPAEPVVDAPKCEVRLYGCDGTTRWAWAGLNNCTVCDLRPNGWLLAVEGAGWNGGRVTERDLQGKVQWNQSVEGRSPTVCQHVPGGNIFLAGQGYLREWTSVGKCRYEQPTWEKEGFNYLYTARPSGTKQALCMDLSMPGQGPPGFWVGLFDGATGKVVRRTKLDLQPAAGSPWGTEGYFRGCIFADGSSVLLAPKGNAWEFARNGSLVREFRLSKTVMITPLAKSNLLGTFVCGHQQGRIAEMDRDGRILWEVFTEDRSRSGRPCLGLVRLGFDRIPPPGRELGSLASRLRTLTQGNVVRRRGAACQLEQLGKHAAPVVPNLVNCLGDPDDQVISHVGGAIWNSAPEGLPALLKGCRSPNPRIRLYCIPLLEAHGMRVDQIAPTLLDAAKDSDASVRATAVRIIGNLGPVDPRMIAVVSNALQDREWITAGQYKNTSVAFWAAHTLGRFGSRAKAAVPALLDAARSADKQTRLCATDAVARVTALDKNATLLNETLVTGLLDFESREKDLTIRTAFGRALDKLGEDTSQAICNLLELSTSPNVSDKKAARSLQAPLIHALGRMGPKGKAAVPMLIAILKEKAAEGQVRAAAAQALGDVGPAAGLALPDLTNVASSDSSTVVRQAAEQAVTRIKRQGQK